jgi:hypothetical protein
LRYHHRLSNRNIDYDMPITKITGVLLFVAACVSLYFGSFWLLVMPRFPGESYFTPERMMSGVGLTSLSGALLVGSDGCGRVREAKSASERPVANSFSLAAER